MAGLYYNPDVHAWGKDAREGIGQGFQMAQMLYGVKLKTRQTEINAAQNQLTMGFKFLELAKGNPETQKAIIGKFISPAFKSLSQQGVMNYSDKDIDDFTGQLDFSNKSTQNLITSLTGAHKRVQSGDMSWKEGQDFFNTALMGYQGELSKTQLSSVKGLYENLKAGGQRASEASLFKPLTETISGVQPQQIQSQFGQTFQAPEIKPTQIQSPSPFIEGLKKDYSQEQIAGMAQAVKAGQSLKDVIKMFPKERAAKSAKAFMLPDNVTTVLSRDGGNTYLDAEGNIQEMPWNALPITTDLAQAQARRAVKEAKKEVAEAPPSEIIPAITPEDAALGGTGPYAMFKAFADRVVGGVLNIETFPETQENRQALRRIKQMSKSALLTSPRGPIWEQQKIDQLFPNPDIFWANPATEAKKITGLRNVMMNEKMYNNEQIASGTLTSKEIQEYRKSNAKIDKVLNLIGEGKPEVGKTTTLTMPDGSTQVFDERGKRIQ